jgi:hypothetical protein
MFETEKYIVNNNSCSSNIAVEPSTGNGKLLFCTYLYSHLYGQNIFMNISFLAVNLNIHTTEKPGKVIF